MIFGIDKIDPERLAVLAPDGTKLTYKDLVRAAGEVAEAIPERGLSFCLCANRPGALAGYLALAESGYGLAIIAIGAAVAAIMRHNEKMKEALERVKAMSVER